MKMKCGCFLCDRFFAVGRKYLYVGTRFANKRKKILLTDSIREELEEIKNRYEARDARRTYAVVQLFDHYQ